MILNKAYFCTTLIFCLGVQTGRSTDAISEGKQPGSEAFGESPQKHDSEELSKNPNDSGGQSPYSGKPPVWSNPINMEKESYVKHLNANVSLKYCRYEFEMDGLYIF